MWTRAYREADQIFSGIGELRTVPLMPHSEIGKRAGMDDHASYLWSEATVFFFIYSEGVYEVAFLKTLEK